jgi:hypothetical protein
MQTHNDAFLLLASRSGCRRSHGCKEVCAALGSFCCLSQLCSYHPQMIKLMRAAMSDNDIELHQGGGAIPNISSLSDPN